MPSGDFFDTEPKHGVTCPSCGSTEVYRSRRTWLEHLFNWLVRFHQRPFYCRTCRTRFWVSLPFGVWRRVMKLELLILYDAARWYLVTLFVALVFAWLLMLFF
jgi:hypothetical protein